MRSFLAAAVLSAILALPASIAPAQESYGYWSTSIAPDGVKVGVIYPDYSPNDFAGLSMSCTPGTSVIAVSVDSPRALKDGAKAQIDIIADGTHATYRGLASHSLMDDSTRIAFDTTNGDPILMALAAASKISYAVQHSERDLPTEGARTSLTEFIARCRR
jgi:hypothetical protein